MLIHSAANQSLYTSVRIEWDEWEGQPTDQHLRIMATGAAGLHAGIPVNGAAVVAYFVGSSQIPEGDDTSAATGAEVWVNHML